MSLKDRHTDQAFIKEKFSKISRWYDFLNSLFSLGLDNYWRWQAVRWLEDSKKVLDLCAGTLPLSKALKRWTSFKGKIIALDFALPMLIYGRTKWQDKDVLPIVGNALCLPLKDNSVDSVMVAFGVRNFSNRLKGLKEMKRVLKPGGKVVILEFSHPPFLPFRIFYFAYLKHLLPKIGGLISQDKEAYQHLTASIQAFYSPQEWMYLMLQAGFRKIRHRYLTGGIVSIYTGRA